MNALTLKGDWNVAKGKLKQKFSQLTESDLTFREGYEDELVGRIQKRVGCTRDEVECAITEVFGSS